MFLRVKVSFDEGFCVEICLPVLSVIGYEILYFRFNLFGLLLEINQVLLEVLADGCDNWFDLKYVVVALISCHVAFEFSR